MTKLFFIVALLPSLSFAARPTRSLHLDFSYGEYASCRADLTVEAGEEYLACELRIDGKQAFLRAKVEPQPKHEDIFSLRVETVEDNGQIKILSSPQIMMLEGEPTKMSGEDKGHPETREEFSVVITRN